jgi:hypothetical protein
MARNDEKAVLGNGVGRTGVEEEGAVLSNLSQGR